MPKRRTRKPGTVSGLSGHHLGMTVRIDGTNYHLPQSVREVDAAPSRSGGGEPLTDLGSILRWLDKS